MNKNVVQKKVILVAAVATFFSCACSSRYSSSGEHLYLRSQNGPNLVIPAPLTTENISHFYDLPSVIGNPNISIVPPIKVANNS